MALKFYIDSQLTDQPIGDTDLRTTIKRDQELNGFYTTQEVTLAWGVNNSLEPGTISGHTYLKALFDSGTCNAADIVVYDEVSDTETYKIFVGVVKVPAMEIDVQHNIISSKLDDNSYFSFIRNNGNIKFSTYATSTKNGQPITPPQVYEVNFFDSATGVFFPSVIDWRKGYRVYDLLAFLIPAITDNRVSFESSFLLSDPLGIELFIFDGAALADPDKNPDIVVSLNELLSELFKLKNLSFYIDQTDPDNPVFRLEDASWFYLGTNILTFTEPLRLKTYIKANKLYGTVNTGSGINPAGLPPIYTWNAGTSYFGWKDESFTPFGQCNTEAILNLENDFVIASNAVNDQVNGATTSNLDETFIVECRFVDTASFVAQAADYSTYAVAPVVYYNVGLNNVNKLANHGSNFQSALTNTANAGLDIFHASMGSEVLLMDQTIGSPLQSQLNTNPAIVEPVPFTDENGAGNYDPGNNYQNLSTDSYYTVPVAGNYSFSTTLDLELINFKECTTAQNNALGQLNILTQYGVIFTVAIEAFTDNTFTTLIASSSSVTQFSADGVYQVAASMASPLPLNSAVRVHTVSQFIVLFPTIFGSNPLSNAVISGGTCGYTAGEPKAQIIALDTSTFQCNGTPDAGLILAQPNAALYKVKVHDFEYDLSMSEFRTIQAVPIGSFTFIKNEIIGTGWLEEFQFSNWTGKSKVKLITQDATT